MLVGATITTKDSRGTTFERIEPFAANWNGTTWTVDRTATLPPAGKPACPGDECGFTKSVLTSVSCPSATSCTAVGSFAGRDGYQNLLVEVWNGSSWSLSHAVQPPTGAGELTAVSCPTSTRCLAAGLADNANAAPVGMSESWDGSRWSVTAPPAAPAGASQVHIDSLWCDPSGCVAVGNAQLDGLSPIAEVWNGSSWRATLVPIPSGESHQIHGMLLNSISCVSTTACMAVGSGTPPGSIRSATVRSVDLAEAWNGTSWTLEPTPNVKGSSFQLLDGVYCSNVDNCVAVGQRGVSSTLGAFWNGQSWTIVNTP
jgi:hypothetical protein